MPIPQWTPNIYNQSKLDVNYNGSNPIVNQYAGNPATNGLYLGQSAPQGSTSQNIGGQAGMYQAAAQTGFNAVFGAFTKPKAANLQAAQITANAEIQNQAAQFNASQARRYARDIQEAALRSYLDEIDFARDFAGTQKAAQSAQGNWQGSTFDAFIDDTINKTLQDIDSRSKSAGKESVRIRLQADMLTLQAQTQYKMAQANAQAIQEQGQLAGILSVFGLS